MKEKKDIFDFWYAVNNTKIIMTPSRHLETFGTTVLNYHLISELMDSVNQVRVREGRMQAHQPQIITPESYSQTMLEGFGEEASKYIDWIKEHEQNIKVLQYGYKLKQESFSEQVISDNIQNVAERVKNEVKANADPLSAVVIGVDDPWDVCLIKLFREVIQNSAPANFQELTRRHMFEDADGIPKGIRNEIDAVFLAASKNSSLINALGKQLQKLGLFEEYQDRFFSLIKTSKH